MTAVDDARARVTADLLPGEHLLWIGRPDPRVHFTPADVFLVPFSVLWCGFAIFWFVGALSSAGIGFAAFGLIFVAVGLYFVFGRFILKARRKVALAYAITDRRAIVATGAHSLSQVPIKGQQVSSRQRNGHVSVRIGAEPRFQQTLYGNTGLDFWDRNAGSVALWDVSDGDALAAALRQAQSQ